MKPMLLFVGVSLGAGINSTRPAVIESGMKEADHLRNVRYCEVFVVTRHGFAAEAAIYNTAGLNDCPEQQWHKLNADLVKRETGAYRVILNGPRYFIMDRNALRDLGPERDFGVLKTRLVARMEVQQGNERRLPYVENTVERQSCYVYEAGRNVYKLHSPNGRSWIMQSYSVEIDPHLDEMGLAHLDVRLSMPERWRFEVQTLRSDLTVCNSGGKAQVLQDDLNNTYQRLAR